MRERLKKAISAIVWFLIKGSSTVELDRAAGEARKRYHPRVTTRILYFLAFGTFNFPYEAKTGNPGEIPPALIAAGYRRMIANYLAEEILGRRIFADFLRVDPGGIFVTELIEGPSPASIEETQEALDEVRTFLWEVAGLSTWQFSARNPRSFSNIIGGLLIDGESCLAASPLLLSFLLMMFTRQEIWAVFTLTGEFPPFDTVIFPRLENSLQELGDVPEEVWVWLHKCKKATKAWHNSEPRPWEKLARALFSFYRGLRDIQYGRELWNARD